MPTKSSPSYEQVALTVLVYEFDIPSRGESDKTIAGRLRRRKLGAFDPVRIAALRKLKDELRAEIGKQQKSKYYDGPRGKRERMNTFVEIEDFDIPRLTLDMIKKYPAVPKKVVRWFVPLSVYVNHLL